MSARATGRPRNFYDHVYRASLTILLGGVAVIFTAALWQIVTGGGSRSQAMRLIAAIPVVPVAGVIGLIASGVARRGALPVFMGVAIGLAVVSAFGWGAVIWRSFESSNVQTRELKLLVTASLVSITLAIMGALLTSADQRRPLPFIRSVLLWTSTVLCAGILLLLWSFVLQRVWGYLLAVTILAGLGFVLFWFIHLITARLLRMRARRIESMPRSLSVAIECPKCGDEQTMTTGLSRCRQCGLALTIDVEEPRCDCGYLLYNLQGGSCPECGRTVAERCACGCLLYDLQAGCCPECGRRVTGSAEAGPDPATEPSAGD
ncbi:MAG: hypothetical protein ACYTF9_05015 [Planctomycetota bacterium]|jgi:hypothetical protein